MLRKGSFHSSEMRPFRMSWRQVRLKMFQYHSLVVLLATNVGKADQLACHGMCRRTKLSLFKCACIGDRPVIALRGQVSYTTEVPWPKSEEFASVWSRGMRPFRMSWRQVRLKMFRYHSFVVFLAKTLVRQISLLVMACVVVPNCPSLNAQPCIGDRPVIALRGQVSYTTEVPWPKSFPLTTRSHECGRVCKCT